jgi:hypothetical protein
MAYEPVLITLDDAKRRVNLHGTTHADVELQQMLDEAHEIVIDYVNQRRSGGDDWAATIATWDCDTAPWRVRAAICRMFADLQRRRGDDYPDDPQRTGLLPADVRALLDRLRDPAIA